MPEIRFDRGGTLRPARRMLDGRVRVDAYISRAGVFPYVLPDGRVVRELRAPEDVGDPASLASFEQVPVTDDHPKIGLLDASTAPQYMKGATGENVCMDGDRVKTTIMVADASLIRKMDAGKVEISSGYTCDVIDQPGVHPVYGRYDRRQINIRGNHAAVVDEGRLGPEISARMDGAGVMVSESRADDLSAAQRHKLEPKMFADPAHEGLPLEDADHVRAAMSRFGQEKFASPDDKRAGYHRVIARAKALGIDPSGFVAEWSPRLDATPGLPNARAGVNVPIMPDPVPNQTPDEALRALNQRVSELETENTRLDAEAKTQTARADAAEKAATMHEKRATELEATRLDEKAAVETAAVKREKERADGLQKTIDGHEARFDVAVKTRSLLLARASAVLGHDAPIFDKSDRDVRVEVVKRLDSTEDVSENVSDAAIEKAFDILFKRWVGGAQSQARVSEVLAGAVPQRRADAPAAVDGKPFVPRRDEWRMPLPSTVAARK